MRSSTGPSSSTHFLSLVDPPRRVESDRKRPAAAAGERRQTADTGRDAHQDTEGSTEQLVEQARAWFAEAPD